MSLHNSQVYIFIINKSISYSLIIWILLVAQLAVFQPFLSEWTELFYADSKQI